jgi:hypothetical protein
LGALKFFDPELNTAALGGAASLKLLPRGILNDALGPFGLKAVLPLGSCLIPVGVLILKLLALPRGILNAVLGPLGLKTLPLPCRNCLGALVGALNLKLLPLPIDLNVLPLKR